MYIYILSIYKHVIEMSLKLNIIIIVYLYQAYAIIYVYVFCLHIWLVYYLHDIKSIHIPPNSMNIPSYSVKYVQVSQASQFLHVFSQVATTPASEVSVARAPVEAGHLGKNRTRKTGPVDPLESLETGDGDVQQRKP